MGGIMGVGRVGGMQVGKLRRLRLAHNHGAGFQQPVDDGGVRPGRAPAMNGAMDLQQLLLTTQVNGFTVYYLLSRLGLWIQTHCLQKKQIPIHWE